MTPVQFGIRSYRTHDLMKTPPAPHPLDILSDILFDIKAETRQRESSTGQRQQKGQNQREEFQEILKREMGR